MDVFLEILALLVLTRLLGEMAERIGSPASVGEILAGVLLAAAAIKFGDTIPFLDQVVDSEAVAVVAELGIFFLVLLAGIEMEPEEIAQSSKASLAVAVGGMAVPLAGGIALAWAFLPDGDAKPIQAYLTGVALAISAIPATVKVFSELGLLHTRCGRLVVSAAVFDDVLGLILLAILLAMLDGAGGPTLMALLLLVAKVVAFFAITALLGTHVYPRISRGAKTLQAAATEFTALAAVALSYGALAEFLGMHWILGAFMAGLYFEKSRVGLRAYGEIRIICETVTRGVLGPLFFAYIGLRVDLAAFGAIPLFLALLIAVAMVGKIVGAGLPALWSGLSKNESLAVGVGMSARGAVELVVLSIAYERGFFDVPSAQDGLVAHLFSALIIVGVVTTVMAPILLRRIAPLLDRPADRKGGS